MTSGVSPPAIPEMVLSSRDGWMAFVEMLDFKPSIYMFLSKIQFWVFRSPMSFHDLNLHKLIHLSAIIRSVSTTQTVYFIFILTTIWILKISGWKFLFKPNFLCPNNNFYKMFKRLPTNKKKTISPCVYFSLQQRSLDVFRYVCVCSIGTCAYWMHDCMQTIPITAAVLSR